MPEHLDDFDLDSHIDRAFADLLEDVGGRTNPPPASTVIERARRRRTTTFAAAAAVVLIVGAAAVASGVGRPSAAPGPAGQLPTPQVFDRAAWASATDGWIDGWKQPSNENEMAWLNNDPLCLATMPDTGPEPERSGRFMLVSDSPAAMFAALADFDDAAPAETSWQQLSGALGDCADARLLRRATWDGAQAESYRIDSPNRTDYFWLARQGHSLGVLWVAERSTPPLLYAIDTQVMTTLVAGLQDPGSFRERDQVTTDTGSASSGTSVADDDFAQALGTWDSGWKQASGKPADVSLPCLSLDSSPGSTGGFGTSIGSNGSYSVSSFTDEAAASVALEAAASVALEDAFSQLESCSQPYVVDRGGRQPEVVVASTDAGVVWIVRNGTNIGFIAVQGGHANPPAEVSAAVGAVIDQALRTTTP